MARKKKPERKRSESAKELPNAERRKRDARRSQRPSKDLVNCQQMHALAHPVRVRILATIADHGTASPKAISRAIEENLPSVAYHITVLRKAGLIAEDRKVPRRGAVEHFYRATAPTLIPPDAWDDLPPVMREQISMCILQEFFDDASASMKAGVFDDSPGELSWTPLVLDALGVKEVGGLVRDFLESVLNVQAKASKRLPKAKSKRAAEATSATVFLASFLSARSPKDEKKASATKRR